MNSEPTKKQINSLAKKLRELAKLLTLRKIDWTHYVDLNADLLKKISVAKKYKRKSYFTFKFEKLKTTDNRLHTFVINVNASKNVAGMFFEVTKSNDVFLEYTADKNSAGDFFEFPYLLLNRVYNKRDTKIETLLSNLDKEIAAQELIIESINKLSN